MRIPARTSTRRVTTEEDRQRVLVVLRATYQEEKGWLLDVEQQFPASDLARSDVSWFLSTRRSEPVGVLRVLYDPPVRQYLDYGLKPIDQSLDIAGFIARERLAEVGRFAVMPERRRGIVAVLGLIRAATREIVARGCTQVITDVFENDPHSPLKFHTRIIGFRPVATHEIGELRHKGRRITLLLDLKVGYQRLKLSSARFFKSLTRGWSEATHQRLAS